MLLLPLTLTLTPILILSSSLANKLVSFANNSASKVAVDAFTVSLLLLPVPASVYVYVFCPKVDGLLRNMKLSAMLFVWFQSEKGKHEAKSKSFCKFPSSPKMRLH